MTNVPRATSPGNLSGAGACDGSPARGPWTQRHFLLQFPAGSAPVWIGIDGLEPTCLMQLELRVRGERVFAVASDIEMCGQPIAAGEMLLAMARYSGHDGLGCAYDIQADSPHLGLLTMWIAHRTLAADIVVRVLQTA